MITSINDITAAYDAIWFGMNSYNVAALLRGRGGKDDIATAEELLHFKAINGSALPKVSVLVPAYKEERVLAGSITSIERSDYPKESFEVLVLMEKDDAATQAVAAELSKEYNNVLPIIVDLPKSGLGKPRALNYGLARSTGSIVGVIDAEDLVDPSMLLESAYMIKVKGYDAVQGILDMANDSDGWTNLMQRAEYGYWYNLYISSLSRANYPMPFGGTTNFFNRKTLQDLGGWDEHNLTEDFELGVRMFNSNARVAVSESRARKASAKLPENSIPFKSKVYTEEFYRKHAADYASTSLSEALYNYNMGKAMEAQEIQRNNRSIAMIRSTTREESPPTVKTWLKQRIRWQQGKIQTFRKNLKNPPKNASRKAHTFLTSAQPHIAAINISGIAISAYALLTNSLSEPIKIFADFNLAMVGFYAAMNAAGYLAATSKEKETIKYRHAKAAVAAVTLPVYWVMQWVADIKAMKLEYIDKSSAWAKTDHFGRHFQNPAAASMPDEEKEHQEQEGESFIGKDK